MVVANGASIPLGVSIHSASPAEVKLAVGTLATVKVPRLHGGRPKEKPEHVVADKAYDSDPLRKELAARGIELVVPHRDGRVKPATQDGRALRRYCRRWKIERSIAWLGNYRRLVVRWDRNDQIYLAFIYIACALISMRHL
jgi:transposase